jgi:hypothetical protein
MTIVAYLLKAIIVKPAERAVARKRLFKHGRSLAIDSQHAAK